MPAPPARRFASTGSRLGLGGACRYPSRAAIAAIHTQDSERYAAARLRPVKALLKPARDRDRPGPRPGVAA